MFLNPGHRGAIRGLTFRKKKHTLYSCSADRSVRVWDLDAMGFVESLFGHQDAVSFFISVLTIWLALVIY
jgi:ribosomal RNA-processing protein 9